jgi:aromatic-L-amino-acid decarboxylase
VAAEHGAWLHVDAAMAGSAMLLPECRPLFDGVEAADSLCWNPHKWLGTILDCSRLYVRDVEHLVRVMSTDPAYLRSAADGEVTQYRDWGIPLGRRFRALKLLFHLRLDGVEAIRGRLRRDLENAQWLAAQVEAEAQWRVLAPVWLQTVCIRHEPPGLGRAADGDVSDGESPDGDVSDGESLDGDVSDGESPDGASDGEALDRHTLAWVEAVNASGRAFLTPSVLDGRWMARISIGAEATERSDVQALWDLIRGHAAASAGDTGQEWPA